MCMDGSFVAQTAELAVSGLNPSILLPIVEHCKVIEKCLEKKNLNSKNFFRILLADACDQQLFLLDANI